MTGASRPLRPVHSSEDRAIGELCAFLALHENSPVGVICRPDRHASNASLCDAILLRGLDRVAVEHTRVFGAPEQPGRVRVLAFVAPAIKAEIEPQFPHWIVQVGIPVEAFGPGRDWLHEAATVARVLAAKLRTVPAHDSVEAPVASGTGRAFARLVGKPRAEGFCSVHPVVWGRDPEDLTVDDFRRALVGKKAVMSKYKAQGIRTLLLLEFEAMAWMPWALEQLRKAAEDQDVSAFDEIYLALTAWTPAFVLPFVTGGTADDSASLGGRFIELREQVAIALARSESIPERTK